MVSASYADNKTKSANDVIRRRNKTTDEQVKSLDVTQSKANDDTVQTLSTSDYGNFTLLVILYLLQGIPVGLSFGSIPFLLKAKLSYSQIAIFSLSSWPYSLKLLWSPIVDSVYWRTIGRRKSWIIPIQLLTAVLFWLLANRIDQMMNDQDIYGLTYGFFLTIVFCATQDIAVDGWALTLLSKESLSYASTAQTIGLNTGYFLSFTVFLALSSDEFCEGYLGRTSLVGLEGYLRFWSIMYGLVTACLILKSEGVESEETMGIRKVYKTIWDICKLPHMTSFIVVLLCSKVGFICHEAVTSFKLLEKGFSKEDLSLSVLLDFPLQIIFGYYAAQWSNGDRPLRPWLYSFYGRLGCGILGMMIVAGYPEGESIGYGYYFLLIIGSTILSSFMSTVQFVSLSAFMTTIADPVIGGTYMTLLNTFSNFGGTWPKFFVLEAVEYLTKNSCYQEEGKDKICEIERDGYYIVGTLCVLIGLITLLSFIKPTIQKLEKYPTKMWKIA